VHELQILYHLVRLSGKLRDAQTRVLP